MNLEQDILDNLIGYGKTSFNFNYKDKLLDSVEHFVFSYNPRGDSFDVISLNCGVIIPICNISANINNKNFDILKSNIEGIITYAVEVHVVNYSYADKYKLPIENFNGIRFPDVYKKFLELEKDCREYDLENILEKPILKEEYYLTNMFYKISLKDFERLNKKD